MEAEAGLAEQAAGALTVASMTGFIRQIENRTSGTDPTPAAQFRRLLGAEHVPTERELRDTCQAAGLA